MWHRITIPYNSLTSAVEAIESFLDYEGEQSGRLDDRTREALVTALVVLRNVVHGVDGEDHGIGGDGEGF